LICIADVSGKGIPAALLMSNFQASLRTLIRKTNDIKEIIEELNHVTYISGNAENFITFYIAIYDYETSVLEYANCGHNEVILKMNNEVHLMTEGTTVLGMFDPLPFLETKFLDQLDDFFIFAYTDGLTETSNSMGDFYGFDRLCNLIESSEIIELSKLHQDIIDSLNTFKQLEDFQDDVTMLSCRIQNL
jgi:sigma-B regulation protein RsbU (phosphoserine phosphatase)